MLSNQQPHFTSPLTDQTRMNEHSYLCCKYYTLKPNFTDNLFQQMINCRSSRNAHTFSFQFNPLVNIDNNNNSCWFQLSQCLLYKVNLVCWLLHCNLHKNSQPFAAYYLRLIASEPVSWMHTVLGKKLHVYRTYTSGDSNQIWHRQTTWGYVGGEGI